MHIKFTIGYYDPFSCSVKKFPNNDFLRCLKSIPIWVLSCMLQAFVQSAGWKKFALPSGNRFSLQDCKINKTEFILFSYTTDCCSISRDARFLQQEAETLKQIAWKGNLFCLEVFWAS